MHTLALPPPPPLPELSGYEVVRRLGVSATSEVLLAVARGPLGFARTVVLKRLVATSTEGRSGDARLAREALAYARLGHPAIVRLYDFVEDAGRLTLVLEHVDGVSLDRIARECRLDEAAVWYVGYRLFLALAAAHAAREPMTREFAPVIHRDVTPANVLVPWDGYVKLSDFGVARLAGLAGDTRPGVIKGTVGYLAPEQVRGEPPSVRTDVYAACLVLRELLLGAPVFPEAGQTELQRLATMASPRLVPLAALRPGLPFAIADALDRGLSPDPELRSLNAEEMVALLRGLGDLEVGRERLVEAAARLRRGDSPRALAFATRPDTSASLFDESVRDLDLVTDTETPQRAITTRPPAPPTSMAMPIVRPPPAPRRPGFASRTSSPLILETPNVMTTAVLPEPVPLPTPRGRAPMLVGVIAAAAIAMGIVIGGTLGLRERTNASATAELRSRPPVAVAPIAPTVQAPVVLTPPPPVEAAPPPASTTGRLLTAASEAGHRIFVDGRFAGSGGAPLVVRCGTHEVRVGSAGRLRRLDVPCNGALEVSR